MSAFLGGPVERGQRGPVVRRLVAGDARGVTAKPASSSPSASAATAVDSENGSSPPRSAPTDSAHVLQRVPGRPPGVGDGLVGDAGSRSRNAAAFSSWTAIAVRWWPRLSWMSRASRLRSVAAVSSATRCCVRAQPAADAPARRGCVRLGGDRRHRHREHQPDEEHQQVGDRSRGRVSQPGTNDSLDAAADREVRRPPAPSSPAGPARSTRRTAPAGTAPGRCPSRPAPPPPRRARSGRSSRPMASRRGVRSPYRRRSTISRASRTSQHADEAGQPRRPTTGRQPGDRRSRRRSTRTATYRIDATHGSGRDALPTGLTSRPSCMVGAPPGYGDRPRRAPPRAALSGRKSCAGGPMPARRPDVADG